jgi:hypothetical protein
MRIFSSAEKSRLVARRMLLTVSSALCVACFLRFLIVYLLGDYDEPEFLSHAISSIWPVGPDGKHE